MDWALLPQGCPGYSDGMGDKHSCGGQCSAVWWAAVQCSVVQYIAVQCSTVYFDAVKCIIVQ